MTGHICSNFNAETDTVFVVDSVTDWRIVPSCEVEGRQIIQCIFCDKPAATLDHYFPYYTTFNRCTEHRGASGKGWLFAGRRWHYFKEGRSACYDWAIDLGAPLESFKASPEGGECLNCRRARKEVRNDR